MFIYKAATAAKYLCEMILLPKSKSLICFYSDIEGGYANRRVEVFTVLKKPATLKSSPICCQ